MTVRVETIELYPQPRLFTFSESCRTGMCIRVSYLHGDETAVLRN